MFKKIMVLLIFIGINFSRFYIRFVIILLYFGVLRLVLSIIFNSCGIYIYCWGNSLVFWRFWGDNDIC